MPKKKPHVSAAEEESTYTLDRMTCRILAGAQAREYTVNSPSKLFTIFDVLISLSMVYFIKDKMYVYALGLFLAWLFLKRKTVRKESILSIRDVGIQVKTTYWGGSSVSRFINRDKIDDIIINEGISFWQIKSYMAILVKGEDRMVVVFEHLLPKLRPVLLRVYQGTRAIIFSENQNHTLDSFYSSTSSSSL